MSCTFAVIDEVHDDTPEPDGANTHDENSAEPSPEPDNVTTPDGDDTDPGDPSVTVTVHGPEPFHPNTPGEHTTDVAVTRRPTPKDCDTCGAAFHDPFPA